MLIQTSRSSPPHHTIEKTVHIDMSADTRVDHHSLDFYLCGHPITVVYSAPIENVHFTNAHFLPAKQFATAWDLLKGTVHDQTYHCVRSFFEDILSVFL